MGRAFHSLPRRGTCLPSIVRFPIPIAATSAGKFSRVVLVAHCWFTERSISPRHELPSLAKKRAGGCLAGAGGSGQASTKTRQSTMASLATPSNLLAVADRNRDDCQASQGNRQSSSPGLERALLRNRSRQLGAPRVENEVRPIASLSQSSAQPPHSSTGDPGPRVIH